MGLEVQLSVLGLALAVDLALGEYPRRLHPTVWMGWLAQRLKHMAKSPSPALERLKGAALAGFVVALFSASTLALLQAMRPAGLLAYVLASAVMLKASFALRSMEEHVKPIAESLKKGDLDGVRALLSLIVRRDTSRLDERLMVSAAVETVAEGTVDGITSPLFYYGLLGVPGAIGFRAINTLDSVVGYRDPYHVNLGWASARLDTLANYLPARLTALLIASSAALLGLDWRGSLRIMLRDGRRTESKNAGWPMSAMAGALGVRLEKQGHYKLGDPRRSLEAEDILRALRVMKATVAQFLLIFTVPMLIIKALAGMA